MFSATILHGAPRTSFNPGRMTCSSMQHHRRGPAPFVCDQAALLHGLGRPIRHRLGGARVKEPWPLKRASALGAMPRPLETFPPMPDTGRCVCGSVVWYVRAEHVGQRGYFHCRRCGRRYREEEERWEPSR